MKQWSAQVLHFIQAVLSSPYWFFGSLFATLIWMALQFFLPHPIDPPKDFFPLSILVYSLVALWIENAMKAAQADQQAAAQLQMDRIEALLNTNQIMLNHFRELTVESARQDTILHSIMEVMEQTIDTVEDNTERLLALQVKGGDSDDSPPLPERPGSSPPPSNTSSES